MRSSRLQRIRDLIHRESRIPFYKQVDLYGLEDGILIGVTGALGLGFRLEGRDLLLQSEEEINDFEAPGAEISERSSRRGGASFYCPEPGG